jgi:hypothetical protein
MHQDSYQPVTINQSNLLRDKPNKIPRLEHKLHIAAKKLPINKNATSPHKNKFTTNFVIMDKYDL